MTKPITLRMIRKTAIGHVLTALYENTSLSNKHSTQILQIALLFLNSENVDIKDFGYRILLKYCIKTKNYVPLYDVAATLGFIPILTLLKGKLLLPKRESFASTFTDAYAENFFNNGLYQTENQRILFDEFKKKIKQTVAVVAPTSYGKSELIENTVRDHLEINVAVVVPSKALISQTRQRINKLIDGLKRQVIVHHDMAFDSKKPLIAVVTQERLLRIFQKNPEVSFDIIFVDEAHNLLSGDKRSRLLASALIINRFRNPKAATKYLTPFLVSTDNLRIINENTEIPHLKITERIKTEDYYVCDVMGSGQCTLYDQYLDVFFSADAVTYKNTLSLLKAKKKKKNIVYLNKPKNIEQFAEVLARDSNPANSDALSKICEEIAEYVHPQYRILRCLRRGVVYHHGAVPDVVRGYIENHFKFEVNAEWIVTNSTLLEGVNVPAQALFVLDNRKGQGNLTTAQFRNLAGRVNRFSEVFHPENGTPELLLPQIYVLNSEYTRANSNIQKYVSNVAKVDKKIEDTLENPLLEHTEENEHVLKLRNEDFTFIENLEQAAVFRDTPQLAATLAGRLCHIHNVFEISIASFELEIDRQLQEMKAAMTAISDARLLMDVIYRVFISKIDESEGKLANLLRLQHAPARAFYAMFFDWRINQMNYGRMIANFIGYWQKIVENEVDTTVFVGRWGTVPRDGFIDNYVDLATLSQYEMVNLAIVRIKEEQDFLDNNLVKFLEVLNDFGLVDLDLYNKVKYGTVDPEQIKLIRSGFSHIAASVLVTRYRSFVDFVADEKVQISKGIRNAFINRTEKALIMFEVENSGLIEQS